MQLLVTLINGGTQATIDTSTEELVRQVEQRAALALGKPLVRLLRAASTQRLRPALTVGEAGLLNGEELCGVAVEQLPTTNINVHFGLDQAEDLAAVHKAVAKAEGGRFVAWLWLPKARGNVDEAVWPELAEAEGLRLSVEGEELATNAARNLRHLSSLRSAHLQFGDLPPASAMALLEALPEHLEELTLRGPEPLAEELPACLLRLQGLRAVALDCPVSASLLEALPSGLESLRFKLPDEPRALAAAVARMLAFKSVHCWNRDSCSVAALASLLHSLPPHVEELDLCAKCLQKTSEDRLAGDFQNLSGLRTATLPAKWSDTLLLLPILPPTLQELSLDFVTGFPGIEKTMQPLLAGLRRLSALKKASLDGDGVPDLVWSRLLAALPPTLEHLEFGRCEGIQVAAAAELRRFAALRMVGCFAKTCDAFLCVLEQLPESVEEVELVCDTPCEFQEVLREKGRLTKTQLQQLLRAKFAPHRASEEDFKAQLSAAFEALQKREEAAGI